MNIQIGTIQDFKYEKLGAGKKLLVKVLIPLLQRPTNWLPVKTQASSSLVEHKPVRKGDQVVVFNPNGENQDGFVDRNLTYVDIPLPTDVDENKFYKLFEDGTIYIHDTKVKTIFLDTPCSLTLNIKKDLKITVGGQIDIDAGGKVNINGSEIHLNE